MMGRGGGGGEGGSDAPSIQVSASHRVSEARRAHRGWHGGREAIVAHHCKQQQHQWAPGNSKWCWCWSAMLNGCWALTDALSRAAVVHCTALALHCFAYCFSPMPSAVFLHNDCDQKEEEEEDDDDEGSSEICSANDKRARQHLLMLLVLGGWTAIVFDLALKSAAHTALAAHLPTACLLFLLSCFPAFLSSCLPFSLTLFFPFFSLPLLAFYRREEPLMPDSALAK